MPGKISSQELNDLLNTQISKISDIGDKTQLGTTYKTDLVGAINEIKTTVDVDKADYAHHYKKDAGSSDAYVVALNPVITSYTEGMTLDIFCKTANTGAATLDAGGGAKDLRKYYNDALETGDIEAGAIITVKWDSANDWWQVTSGIKPATDTAKFKSGNSTFTDNDTAQTFTDAFCTANSLVTICITSATKPQGTWTVTSAAGEFTITSTATESADITFDYYIIKVV